MPAALEREDGGRDAKRRGQEERRERLDDALEQGLEDSFPGSDPVSVIQPPSSVYDKNEAKQALDGFHPERDCGGNPLIRLSLTMNAVLPRSVRLPHIF